MSINMNDDKNIVEEVGEELRAILIFSDPSPWRKEMKRSMTDPKNNPRVAERLDEQLNHAAEELITGDSDDPPLSEEAVEETLRMTSNARRLKPRPI